MNQSEFYVIQSLIEEAQITLNLPAYFLRLLYLKKRFDWVRKKYNADIQ